MPCQSTFKRFDFERFASCNVSFLAVISHFSDYGYPSWGLAGCACSKSWPFSSVWGFYLCDGSLQDNISHLQNTTALHKRIYLTQSENLMILWPPSVVLAWLVNLLSRVWKGGGGGPDPAFPLLFHVLVLKQCRNLFHVSFTTSFSPKVSGWNNVKRAL